MTAAISKPAPVTVKLTRKGMLAYGMLSGFLRPKLAQDARIDLPAILKDVRRSNFTTMRPSLERAIKTAVQGKLAKDASVEELATVLDIIDAHEPEGLDAEEPPPPMMGGPQQAAKEPLPLDALPAFLKEKGMSEDDFAHALELHKAQGAKDEDSPADLNPHPVDPEGTNKRHSTGAKDEPPPFPGKPDVGKGPKAMDKKAMDAAINAALKRQSDMFEAKRLVRPWVGEIEVTMDSADEVLRTTLDALGVKTEGIHPSAYRTILELQPKPGQKSARGENSGGFAMDAASRQSFDKLFPEVSRINVIG